ncbi:MAG: carboxypeptidase regulatory-like domain-containing protein [Acidobacteria bacterium]|nr:carboxypeptidase regulatory-like domain-containing protein [Acidobacteriota bacterium]
MVPNIHKLKLIVLALFILGSLIIVFTGDRSATEVEARSNGSPNARTGAPSEQTCTSCHNSNSGPGTIQILAPATYTPGQTIQITVTQATTDTTRRAWGFQLTALDTATNSKAGTLTATTSFTAVANSSTRQYMNQSGTGVFRGQANGATWTFNWTAPAASVGPVKFYAAGLQADNQDDDTGDQMFLTNLTLSPGAAATPTPTPTPLPPTPTPTPTPLPPTPTPTPTPTPLPPTPTPTPTPLPPTPTPTPLPPTPTPTPTPMPTPTPTPACLPNANALQDGGFESTNAFVNPSWTSVSTTGSTLCSGAGCGLGAVPRTGAGFIRFDGLSDGSSAYTASVQQTVVIPVGSNAVLRYYLKAGMLTAPANSAVTISLGGTVVQTINEPAVADNDYVLRFVDLSAFADGVPRTLSFNYTRPAGTSGSDVVMIDDAALGINCGETAASITGRVLTPNGLGVQNAVVVLIDPNGLRRIATTSSFGIFTFENVPATQVYMIGVRSKRYRYPTRSMLVTANMTNIDFWGLQ